MTKKKKKKTVRVKPRNGRKRLRPLVVQKTSKIDEKLVRQIRMANIADLAYVEHLQNVWSNNIGFLPRAALRGSLERKQTLVVMENGSPAGYLNWCANKKGQVHVIQVAIDPELLRTTLGTKIMRTIERSAIKGDCSIIRLCSRSNLTANLMWPELGFSTTAIYQRNTRRGLPLIEWTKQLIEPTTAIHSAIFNGRGHRKNKKIKTHLPDMSLIPVD